MSALRDSRIPQSLNQDEQDATARALGDVKLPQRIKKRPTWKELHIQADRIEALENRVRILELHISAKDL